MSDMALIAWRRKAARPFRSTIVAESWRKACRLVIGHPALALGALALCLVAVVPAMDRLPAQATPDAAPAPGLRDAKGALAAANPQASKGLNVVALRGARPLAAAAQDGAAWLEIIKPISIFSLEAPEFATGPLLYKARRHQGGGGRQDTIAVGTLGSDDPSMRLSLYRRGTEFYGRSPTFADLVHQAAEAGFSITRSGLPDLLTTRFGRFEIVDLALAPVPDGTGLARHADPVATPDPTPLRHTPGLDARPPTAGRTDRTQAGGMPCTGLRLILDRPALTITGLMCGAHQHALSHERVGCLLDRLDLASGGEDRQLVDFFAGSELRRNPACSGTRLGPDLVHAAWLDDTPPAEPHPAATPRKKKRRH